MPVLVVNTFLYFPLILIEIPCPPICSLIWRYIEPPIKFNGFNVCATVPSTFNVPFATLPTPLATSPTVFAADDAIDFACANPFTALDFRFPKNPAPFCK